MDGNLIVTIASAVGAGLVSSLGTVAALKVHISYLKENLDRVDRSVQRAHGRLDMQELKSNEKIC